MGQVESDGRRQLRKHGRFSLPSSGCLFCVSSFRLSSSSFETFERSVHTTILHACLQTGSNLGSLFWNEHSNTLSLYFTFCTYGDQRAKHMQMLIMDSTTQGRSWGAPRSIAESVRADGKVLAFFGALTYQCFCQRDLISRSEQNADRSQQPR